MCSSQAHRLCFSLKRKLFAWKRLQFPCHFLWVATTNPWPGPGRERYLTKQTRRRWVPGASDAHGTHGPGPCWAVENFFSRILAGPRIHQRKVKTTKASWNGHSGNHTSQVAHSRPCLPITRKQSTAVFKAILYGRTSYPTHCCKLWPSIVL